MDITDYSNKYAKDKSALDEVATRVRESYKSSVDDMENTHKMKREKERNNYQKNLSDAQKKQQEIYESNSKKADDVVKQRKKEYSDDVESLKRGFDKHSTRDREEVKSKIKNIQQGYQDSLDKQKESQEQMLSGSVESVQGKMRHLINYYNGELKGVQNASRELLEEQNDKNLADKRRLVGEFSDEKYYKMKNDTAEKNDIRKRNDELLSQIRKNSEEGLSYQKKNFDRILDNKSDLLYDSVDNLKDNFNKASGKMVEENKNEQKKLAEENKKLVVDVWNDAAKEKKDILSQYKSLSNKQSSHGEFLKNQKDQQELNHQKMYKRVREETGKVREAGAKHMQAASDQMSNVVGDVKNDLVLKNTRNVTNLEKTINQQKINLDREKTATFDTYNGHVKDLELKYENQGYRERKMRDHAVIQGRKEYANSLGMLQDQHEKSLDGVKKDTAIDKTRFIEQKKRESSAIAQEQRKNFIETAQKRELSFSTDLEQRDMQNEKIRAQYEKKIDMLQEKFINELDKTKKIHSEIIAKRDDETKNMMDTKEYKYFNKLMDVKRDFDKRISNTKNNNQMEIERLIERYEKKIDILITENKANERKIKNEANEKLIAMERTKVLQDNAKKEQYEHKIEKLIERDIENRNVKESSKLV